MADFWSTIEGIEEWKRPNQKKNLKNVSGLQNKLKSLQISPKKKNSSLQEDSFQVFSRQLETPDKQPVSSNSSLSMNISTYLPTIPPLLEVILESDIDKIVSSTINQNEPNVSTSASVSESNSSAFPRKTLRKKVETDFNYELPGTFVPTVRIDLTISQTATSIHMRDNFDQNKSRHRQNYGYERPTSPEPKFYSSIERTWTDLRENLKQRSIEIRLKAPSDSKSWISTNGKLDELLKVLKEYCFSINDVYLCQQKLVLCVLHPSSISQNELKKDLLQKAQFSNDIYFHNGLRNSCNITEIPVIMACDVNLECLPLLLQSLNVYDLKLDCLPSVSLGFFSTHEIGTPERSEDLKRLKNRMIILAVKFNQSLIDFVEQENSVFPCFNPDISEKLSKDMFPHLVLPVKTLELHHHVKIVSYNQELSYLANILKSLRSFKAIVTSINTIRTSDLSDATQKKSHNKGPPFVTLFSMHMIRDTVDNLLGPLVTDAAIIKDVPAKYADCVSATYSDNELQLSPAHIDRSTPFSLPRTIMSKKNAFFVFVSMKTVEPSSVLETVFTTLSEHACRILLLSTVWATKSSNEKNASFFNLCDGPMLIMVLEDVLKSGNQYSMVSSLTDKFNSRQISAQALPLSNREGTKFATSVGAKVLTLNQACIIASIAEMAGALLMGSKVTATIATSIVDPNFFSPDSMDLLVFGMFSTLLATAIWLVTATHLKLPVSATHCVVAALVGFGVAAGGSHSINWTSFARIGISWILSPLLSGSLSSGLLLLVSRTILDQQDSFRRALVALPFIYALSISINFGPVLFELIAAIQTRLGQNVLSVIVRLAISFSATLAIGTLIYFGVKIFHIPRLNNREYREVEEDDGPTIQMNSIAMIPVINNNDDEHEYSTGVVEHDDKKNFKNDGEEVGNHALMEPLSDPPPISIQDESHTPTDMLFSKLQILTAIFTSFNHGGNDVSNAIGPLIAIISIYQTGNLDQIQNNGAPFWVLSFGGIGLIIGLSLWGKGVIETVGRDLTPISPSKGFCIEMGAAITVLFASIVGLPVSSTHCKVGSVVAIGLLETRRTLNYNLLLKILARQV